MAINPLQKQAVGILLFTACFSLFMPSANSIADYHGWRRNFLLRKSADDPPSQSLCLWRGYTKRQHRYQFDAIQINKSSFRADCSRRFRLHQETLLEYRFDSHAHLAGESSEQVGYLTSRHPNRSCWDMHISLLIYGYNFSFHRYLVFIVLSSFHQPVHIF